MAGMRRFDLWLAVYAGAVLLAFAIGCIKDDGSGVAFIPTMVLTLPWWLGAFLMPRPMLSVVSTFHDAPLFVSALLLNITLAALVRSRLLK